MNTFHLDSHGRLLTGLLISTLNSEESILLTIIKAIFLKTLIKSNYSLGLSKDF